MGQKNKKTEKGQALVEYVLLVLTIVGIFTSIQYITVNGIGKIWKKLASEVAAPCPTCPASDEFRK